MIYRHHKGGLYFLEGYATPFSNTFYDKSKTTIEVIAKAFYEPTLEEIDVVLVYDSNLKNTYYAYKSEEIKGVMCFYRGLNGRHWLRSREDFFKEIDKEDVGVGDIYQVPRFEKVSGEYLFDTISDLLPKQDIS
jgi:hypothetical protein